MGYFCAGTFQKLFSGNIFKKHLAGTFKNTFGGNNFMAEKFDFFYFKNFTKFSFLKIKVQKLNPKTPLSLSCPICFNIASYV